MYKNGFIKVASVTPKLTVGNPLSNVKEMLEVLKDIEASITLFPELGVTAYTCNDLFFHEGLLRKSEEAVSYLLSNHQYKGVIVFGAPLEVDGVLYNCAFVAQGQKILGIVPKFYLPNTGEFYEKRWFQSGFNIIKHETEVLYNGQTIPFGYLMFKNKEDSVSFGVEVCEDMWAPISPGNILSLNGARMILNLSASNEVLGKREIRKRAILEHSRRNAGAYVYSSAGVNESSSETVFSGHNIIAQNSELIVETENFNQESEVLYGDIDLDKIDFSRRTNASYRDSLNQYRFDVQEIIIDFNESEDYHFSKKFDRTPFVPKKHILKDFEKIAALQENALIKRVKHVRTNHILLGISGGLDSTLALLVACRAFDAMKLDRSGIIGVTMPGMHTSSKTYTNAIHMMKSLQVTIKEIDINDHVQEHFKLIDHDGVTEDITYENTQARARTMILMNLANSYRGIVLGTGDLSEMALGWCTYNGDQMSMYGINVGIPKTLVRFMIEEYAKEIFTGDVQDTLLDIVNTPISPELTSNQETEDSIGKYEINDFIIHRLLRFGDSEERIEWLLPMVFDLSKKEAQTYASNFFRRFYSQQFKRQATPDGPKILDVSVNPRGDLRLPSDIDYIK